MEILELTECRRDGDSYRANGRKKTPDQANDDGSDQSLNQEVRRYGEIISPG
jgi:hypothetical protein